MFLNSTSTVHDASMISDEERIEVTGASVRTFKVHKFHEMSATFLCHSVWVCVRVFVCLFAIREPSSPNFTQVSTSPGKNWLNFGSHPFPDPDLGLFEGSCSIAR